MEELGQPRRASPDRLGVEELELYTGGRLGPGLGLGIVLELG